MNMSSLSKLRRLRENLDNEGMHDKNLDHEVIRACASHTLYCPPSRDVSPPGTAATAWVNEVTAATYFPACARARECRRVVLSPPAGAHQPPRAPTGHPICGGPLWTGHGLVWTDVDTHSLTHSRECRAWSGARCVAGRIRPRLHLAHPLAQQSLVLLRVRLGHEHVL